MRGHRQAAELERVGGTDFFVERLCDARSEAGQGDRTFGQIKPQKADGDHANQDEAGPRADEPVRQPDEKRKLRSQRAAQHGGRVHLSRDEGIPGLAHAANIVAVIDQTGSGPSATD